MGAVAQRVAERFDDQVTLDFLHPAADQRGDAVRALLGRELVRALEPVVPSSMASGPISAPSASSTAR